MTYVDGNIFTGIFCNDSQNSLKYSFVILILDSTAFSFWRIALGIDAVWWDNHSSNFNWIPIGVIPKIKLNSIVLSIFYSMSILYIKFHSFSNICCNLSWVCERFIQNWTFSRILCSKECPIVFRFHDRCRCSINWATPIDFLVNVSFLNNSFHIFIVFSPFIDK